MRVQGPELRHTSRVTNIWTVIELMLRSHREARQSMQSKLIHDARSADLRHRPFHRR
ncbi:hypothetical protein CHELA40_10828 [Chelatococcus asaccharovorans]|nr:hypothetical protein CHELA40_10828 [Chelatococcus asaccharovorans]CAH1685975.1 hypothetical protein CHELA17_64775 [Chelatococcus asaccharovorans]